MQAGEERYQGLACPERDRCNHSTEYGGVLEWRHASLRANGLGLTPAQADEETRELETLFPLIADTPNIYREWRRLVVEAAVSGVQVHDARLAAAMRVHGITHLLAFNVRDFRRFGA